MFDLTVAIPVGPHPSNVRWMDECLASVHAQSEAPAAILLIDDGAGLNAAKYPGCRIWRSAWPMGPAGAFNACVGAAETEFVFLLGSDDMLTPDCVARCHAAWNRTRDLLGYYYTPLRYLDTGEEQNVPCNAAMVTRSLWNLTGGFPPEAGVGACDTHLVAMMLAARGRLGHLYSIEGPPAYLYRRHPDIDTYRHGDAWQGVLGMVRGLMQRRALGEHV